MHPKITVRRLRTIFQSVQSLNDSDKPLPLSALWELICYSPKTPLRSQQQQLVDEAEKLQGEVMDRHFAKRPRVVNAFRWGEGTTKVLLTHGWGSKALDFADLIVRLKEVKDLEIIAFDAPGNGSSEGDLSNLLLYIEAIKNISSNYGVPDILIGHSLGAMANLLAVKDLNLNPSLIVSLAPLVRLKENFVATFKLANVPDSAQHEFFISFEKLFGLPASYFNLTELLSDTPDHTHWIGYDPMDEIHPSDHLLHFAGSKKGIVSKEYPEVGHSRIIKDPQVIKDIVNVIKERLS